MSKYVSACNAFAKVKDVEVTLVAGQEIELSPAQLAVLPERTRNSLKLIEGEESGKTKVQKPA